jgi:hypothetical protein
MAYSRIPLSGSTNGRPIPVAATATPGTTFHTAQSGTTFVDVVTLYATNTDTTIRTLTLEWGGTGVGNNMVFQLPPKATVLLFTDLVIQNSLVCAAFCDVASVVNLAGFVNRGA